jgi:hypothetical protein
MFVEAENLVVQALFTGAYRDWVVSDEGKLWLKFVSFPCPRRARTPLLTRATTRCRDVARQQGRHLRAIVYFQMKVRADQAVAFERRKAAKAEYLATKAAANSQPLKLPAVG